MSFLPDAVFYTFSFLAVYAQVFFLITFLENKSKILIRTGEVKLKKYPSVTVIVPSFNEESTVFSTVKSLLNLNYPKEKLKIFLVDDGSTDNTWSILQKFSKHKNIQIFRKENGGKHTALNLGLKNVKTEFLGCLDADSVVDPDSLTRLMSYFESSPDIMAVAPSIMVHNPRNIVQNAQKVEYHLAVFAKKMLGFLGAIHVTPGPLTIFRKKVFTDLGPYRHAHNTEDMEIAYRMQKHHYRIEQCNDAYVYTNTPASLRKLFKQRLRWIYGFINNTIDYRDLIFKKKYGNFSTFTLPAGIFAILAAGLLAGRMIYSLVDFIASLVLQVQTVGLPQTARLNSPDSFFISTESIFFLIFILYILVIASIVLGRKMAEGKWGLSWNTVYFFSIFSVMGPLWLLQAVFNTVLSRVPTWR